MKRLPDLESSPLVAAVLAAIFAQGVATQGFAAQPTLMSPQEVLGRIEQPAATGGQAAQKSQAAQLLTDIRAYRAQASKLAPGDAAARWFDLFDRSGKLDVDAAQSDFAAYDPDTAHPVGIESMFASLPPPSAWPALRQIAGQRVARAPRNREPLALRFLTEVLDKDSAAAGRTLIELEAVFAGLAPDERDIARVALANARSRIARAYGSAADIAAVFAAEVRAPSSPYASIEVPDLIGLVDEQQATALLTAAIASPNTLHVESGDATRALARRVALDNIERMRTPQWELADSIDSAHLYEALEKRFDPAAADAPAEDDADKSARADYLKREASAWYFLASVIDGRQRDAERALATISSTSEAYVPREAVDALRQSGHEAALYQFLESQLAKRPEVRAWDLYIREAAFAGHSADALALIDSTLKRADLPVFLAADLHVRRASALLAADRLDQAEKEFRVLLAVPPARGEVTLTVRTEAALKAAAVGRLAQRRALAKLGLDFALAAEGVMPADNDRNPQLADHTRLLWRELRRQGRDGEVQAFAVAQLSGSGARTGFQSLGGYVQPAELQALVEVAGIWSAAGRHADVMRLVNESTRWNVVDAGQLLSAVDSLDLQFGVMLARALEATGDRAAALRVARATQSQSPGKDASYEIIARLDPAAAETFDALFAQDEYEERPLIWKAVTQLAAGSLPEAEATIRRAIAIDPSDGEQGVNDRMRAYAVLAQILERKGDAQGAATYRKAVEAIRISENADAFHEAGMYERAFKGYRDGLEQFADAYCIQSRLAVQLYSQGRRTEALEHYRRAYELMPESFGRVESHCFGCESVFQGSEAQGMADRVFSDAIRKAPAKPQVHYLLAYLREQQGRPADALQPLRQAVSLDPRYLNAWVRLDGLSRRTYIEAAELDIARLKQLELDPLARHARYSLEDVTDLGALWRGVEHAGSAAAAAKPLRSDVYALKASAAALGAARDTLTPEMREQMRILQELAEQHSNMSQTVASPAVVLGRHHLVEATKMLIGLNSGPGY